MPSSTAIPQAMYKGMLTVAMLIDPCDPPDHWVSEHIHLQQAVITQALQLQILDRREEKCYRESQVFKDELAGLRKRYTDLQDAPPLTDHLRFPEMRVLAEGKTFNRAYRQHLEMRVNGDPLRSSELHDALNETDYLYNVLDAASDAKNDLYYILIRRLALKRLRNLVGEEMYNEGRLPPHVPLHRFQRID